MCIVSTIHYVHVHVCGSCLRCFSFLVVSQVPLMTMIHACVLSILIVPGVSCAFGDWGACGVSGPFCLRCPWCNWCPWCPLCPWHACGVPGAFIVLEVPSASGACSVLGVLFIGFMLVAIIYSSNKLIYLTNI